MLITSYFFKKKLLRHALKKKFDVSHFIIFFKKIYFENGLKTGRLYILYRYWKAHPFKILTHQ